MRNFRDLTHGCVMVNTVAVKYSRANAPTGSAGEESVSSCWVAVAGFWWVLVVVVVVVCCLLFVVCCLLFVVVARRARARQTHPQKLTQTARARARREPAHMRKEREPTNSAKTMVFTMFLQQAR